MINAQNIWFIQIPAMTVASIQCISTSPEKDNLKAIIDFMEHIKLDNKISVLRHFGYVPQFDKCGNADIDILRADNYSRRYRNFRTIYKKEIYR